VLKFKAWRYKCEYCGKNGRSSGHMRKHEEGCTANPNRICRFHRVVTDEERAAPTVAVLLEVLAAHRADTDHGLKALRESCDNCPCCILAALRQSGLTKGYADEEGYTPPAISDEQFNFKEEHAAVWAKVNERNAEASEREAYY
jgi:hypothetical protein